MTAIKLGFGKDKSKSSGKTDNSIDPYTSGLFTPTFNQATSLLSGTASPYAGTLSAPTSPLASKAQDLATSNLGAGQDSLAAATRAAQDRLNYQPAMVGAGQVAGMDLSAYRNPYEDQVVNASLGDIDRARRLQINEDSGGFSRSGAWGGSRQGVADAATNTSAMRQSADTAAQLRQAGYQSALTLAGQDLDRRGQADLANQQAGLSALQAGYQGASTLGELAARQQAMRQGDINTLSSLGQQDQAAQQSALDRLYQEYLRQYQDPFSRAQALSGLLNTIPTITDSRTSGKQSGYSLKGEGSYDFGGPSGSKG